jgi:hypothetical protein
MPHRALEQPDPMNSERTAHAMSPLKKIKHIKHVKLG